jgi:ABC-type nitrate/sulfonate/bicarbonate transport system permease component
VLGRFRGGGNRALPPAADCGDAVRDRCRAIPIIVFAPITNNWFGVTGMSSKIAIAAILCFFRCS